MSSILVTGGAGYIGSHLLLALLDAGYSKIYVLDDLSTGVRQAIPDGVILVEGDIRDSNLVQKILGQYKIDIIFHLAGVTSVVDSMKNPNKYFAINTEGSKRLIDAAVAAKVKQFIFSSTAAVYGPENAQVGSKILETGVLSPVSPYGQSKLEVEQYLQALPMGSINYTILRYFNVVGADKNSRAGLWGAGESLMQMANDVVTGKRDQLYICGTDYPTPDGTPIRDFIHVSDLVTAHIQLAEHMNSHKVNDVFNVGYSQGSSVQEVIHAYSHNLGNTLPHKATARRAGDLCYVVADTQKIIKAIGWQPEYDNKLNDIVASEIKWLRQNKKYKLAT